MARFSVKATFKKIDEVARSEPVSEDYAKLEDAVNRYNELISQHNIRIVHSITVIDNINGIKLYNFNG